MVNKVVYKSYNMYTKSGWASTYS